MVRFDFERINSRSPYKVVPDTNGCVFVTDSGIRCGAYFDPDDLLKSSEAYQFTLLNPENRPSPRDSKLRDTILVIIREFFESNQSTLLYICETGDGRQEMRDRLFTHWFHAFANEKEYYYRHMEVLDEGVINYITMILRRDNPDAALVLEEWDSNALALSAKPEQDF